MLLAGLTAGYTVLAFVGAGWPLALAVVAVMACSAFVQASEGAVFAIVPLVAPRVSGQIAGLAGAYGNIGAVCFLTVLLFVPAGTFFALIAAASLVGTVACRWLPEPGEPVARSAASPARLRAGVPVAAPLGFGAAEAGR